MFKTFALAGIVGGAFFLAHAFCWAPATCNRLDRRLKTLSLTAVDATAYRAPLLARQILDGVGECHDRYAPNIDIAMIKALSERLVGRPADAVLTYQQALRYSHRPELYLNLGLTLAEDHRREEALKALMIAVEAAPSFSQEILDGELKSTVEEAVLERNRQIREGRHHD